MITEQDVLNSLKHIIDPDFNQDIVSLGFIKNIKIDQGKVSFDIALTTPACPIKEEFHNAAQHAVLKLDGVDKVDIQMTTQPRTRQSRNPNINTSSLKDVREIIAVSSCKGGVGKSTLAVHMALELAQRGFRVGLVDADIYGPSIPTLLNIQNPSVQTNEEKRLIPIEHKNLKVMSFGFLLGDSPAILRGPIVTQYIQQLLLGTEWGALDYLFIDMPPGTGDVQITITQTLPLSGSIIVTTPHTLSLIDVARGILMFEKVNVPILGVIENMAYFQAQDFETKHYVFGQPSTKNLEERFGISTLAHIPILPQLSMSSHEYVGNSFIMDAVDKAVRSLGKRSMESIQAPEIKADEQNISLRWSDGREQTVSNFELRLNSQDALSVDEFTGKTKLKPEDIRKDIAAQKITPLGNYALSIEWNDGHKSGIYTYRLIEELSGREN